MPFSSWSPQKKLLALLVANGVTSVAHYAHNIVRFVEYPEPPWLDPTRVDILWFVMTPIGVSAYLLFRAGRARAALVASAVYGLMNLLVLGHYLIAPPWELSPSINALILPEAVAAVLLLAYTAWRTGDDAHRALEHDIA